VSDNELGLINILNNRSAEKKTFYLIGYEEPVGGAESFIQHVEEATNVATRYLNC